MTKFKKLLAVALAALCCSHVFAADDESGRFFELKFDLPFGISNNTLALADYLVPEIIIDLGEFADNMPSEGFVIGTRFDPSIAATVQIKNGPKVSAKAGLNLYTRLGLSKDVFDFIGNGNSPDEDLQVKESLDGYLDLFGYVDATVGLGFGDKYYFGITPSLFTTLYHMNLNNSYVMVYNKMDTGAFGYTVEGNVDAYSVIPMNETIITPEYWQHYNDYLNNLWTALGFDCAADFHVDVLDRLQINGYCRVPIIPSHLSEKTSITVKSHQETSVNEISTGEISDIENEFEFGETTEVEYYINRPFKANVGAKYQIIPNFLICYGNVGLGIEHPFAKDKEEMGFYVDYLVALKLKLMSMFNMTISSERTDMIYSNSVNLAANLKFVELDLGASLSSSNFVSSFRGAGLSAYISLCIGF